MAVETIDIAHFRRDFPILTREVNSKPLVYFDNAASTQMPLSVMERMNRYQRSEHANVHRGIHTMSQEATDHYEQVRGIIAEFVNAPESEAVIYTYGTTDSINLVAQTWGRQNLKPADTVLISNMEHHSNIVPWQMLAEQLGFNIQVIPINERGEIDLEAYADLFAAHSVKLVCVNHVSNALGTINPVAQICQLAHEYGALTMVDGAQAMSHEKVDVQVLGADFYAVSGHKFFGPTGVGALISRKELLEKMPPYRGGGEMILKVSFAETIYNQVPFKFEAGTPAITQVIGMGEALNYIRKVGIEEIARHEHHLLAYGTQRLQAIDKVRIIGTAKNKASILSFVVKGHHPHDIGTFLDQEGIEVRAGHHCAQPVMDRFQIPATTRASFAFYNTVEEVDFFADTLEETISFLS